MKMRRVMPRARAILKMTRARGQSHTRHFHRYLMSRARDIFLVQYNQGLRAASIFATKNINKKKNFKHKTK
jgi:hypothetical protein